MHKKYIVVTMSVGFMRGMFQTDNHDTALDFYNSWIPFVIEGETIKMYEQYHNESDNNVADYKAIRVHKMD